MAKRLAWPARVLAAACLLCTGCSLPQIRPATSHAVRHREPTHAVHAAVPHQASGVRWYSILPFSAARLEAATAIAGKFAIGYDIWSWRQSAHAWLAYLRPMTTGGLYAALARADSIPSVLAQRDSSRQASTATLTGIEIRDLSPSSITFVVTISQAIVSTSGVKHTIGDLALTLITQGGAWVVYDVEPASAGNS